MEKKILFLKSASGWKDPAPPLAFAYLGDIAKKKGFKVMIENLNAQYNKLNVDDIINLIRAEKPLIVGVSIFTNYAYTTYQLLEKIRKHSKIIIAGGPHATLFPEEVIEKGADIVVIGEGEKSFSELVDAIVSKKSLSKIKGIVYKEKGKVRYTKPVETSIDLDKLPLPNKELFRKSDYVKTKAEINNFGNILSSRGCPGQCTYCYHSLFGRCFRYRSAKSVFKEVLSLYKMYGITHIDFLDDAFTVNRPRLLELCNLLIRVRLPIKWVCATRIDYLDEEVIFKMSEAGCVMISLGIESCIPTTLVKIKKTTNPEWYVKHAEDVLKWCKEAEIRAGVNILTGFPWDTVEDIKELQKFVRRIRKYVTQGFMGGILQPMPNTEIYDEYAKEYSFEKWWLTRKPFFSKEHPFFRVYYHIFWDQLQNNFFNLDKKVFNEIDKLYKLMGRWNLRVMSMRRFKNPAVQISMYFGLLILSNLSLLLYQISPSLESKIMVPIIRFGYRFKFKNVVN